MGSAVDLPAILNRLRAQLRLGVHSDAALQEEWNRGGPEALVFEVLDTLEPPDAAEYDPRDDLRALESLWREKLRRPGTGSASCGADPRQGGSWRAGALKQPAQR